MKLWKSKTDKQADVEKAELDRERQRLRQFQMESAAILDEAITELEATRSVLSAASEYEVAGPEITYPVADFVVALDARSNVLSVIDIDDVTAVAPFDQKVQAIQSLITGGALSQEKVHATRLEDSIILTLGGKGLFIGAVWHGEPTSVEEDMTRGSWESALQFFDGQFPEGPSETDTLTLYNSVRASFGKDVMEIEGLAPELRARVAARSIDRAILLKEADDLALDLRAQGFSTTRLHEIRAMPIKEATQNLDKLRSDLRFVGLLEARFYKLDATSFPDDGQTIFDKLSSIKDLTQAAMEIQALEAKVMDWEAQEIAQGITADGFDVTVEQQPGYNDIMDGIKNLELSGYDTKFVYRMLYTGDLDVARQAMMYCLSQVERLRQVEDRLVNLWAEGYEKRFMSIQSKLTNPAMAATVEKELKALEAVIKADSERQRIFTLLRGKLDHWSKEGFNISELQSVLSKDPDTIIETFKRFSSKLSFLVKLEDELNGLEAQAKDLAAFDDDIVKIRKMLMDPSMTTQVMDEVRTLRYLISRRGDAEAIRTVIRTKVARWWEKGYDVSVLQQYMEQPIEVLEEVVNEYEGFITVLEKISKEMDTLYLEGLEKEEKEIRALLHDIKNVSEAKRKVQDLKVALATRIKEEDRARADGKVKVGPPIKSPHFLGTVVLRIGHRLPVALWGKEPGDLAEELLAAEYGKTKDGELIVKVGRDWFYGDPRKERQFLLKYTVKTKG